VSSTQQIQRLLNDDYVDGLDARSLDDLRDMKA